MVYNYSLYLKIHQQVNQKMKIFHQDRDNLKITFKKKKQLNSRDKRNQNYLNNQKLALNSTHVQTAKQFHKL